MTERPETERRGMLGVDVVEWRSIVRDDDGYCDRRWGCDAANGFAGRVDDEMVRECRWVLAVAGCVVCEIDRVYDATGTSVSRGWPAGVGFTTESISIGELRVQIQSWLSWLMRVLSRVLQWCKVAVYSRKKLSHRTSRVAQLFLSLCFHWIGDV